MKKIIVKEAVSLKDLKRFTSFPFKLYRNNPCWIPALLSDERATLDKSRNPAFDYCEAKYWLAYINGEIVGRIAGIINYKYIKKWKNKYARFGWIDFIDDLNVSAALIQTVENWAREKGMLAVHGPLGFTDFDPEGMLTEGFETPGTMATIYNYEYYPRHLERLGYVKDVDWLEYEINIPAKLPAGISNIATSVEKKYKLRILKAKGSKELLKYAKGVFDLLNIAYEDLYGVIPLSDAQTDKYTEQYFSFIQPEYVPLIIDKNEKVAGFAICIPSLSQALRKSKGKLFPFGLLHLYKALRWKNPLADFYLIAIRPELQGKGVNALLIKSLTETFIRNKVLKVITHPVLEENNKVNTFWKHLEARPLKRRRCYIKQLPVSNPLRRSVQF